LASWSKSQHKKTSKNEILKNFSNPFGTERKGIGMQGRLSHRGLLLEV
jgi:hypothetical protein